MSGNVNFTRFCALTIISAMALSASSISAQSSGDQSQPVKTIVSTPAANINVTPRRLILDPSQRTGEVLVFNQGTAPVTVNVALVDNVMLQSGEIVPVSALDEQDKEAQATLARMNSAKQLILATPSRLTLRPGQGKTIRLRGSVSEVEGEARTHLTITTIPSRDTGLTAEAAALAGTDELIFQIQTVFGISIPLILREGPAEAAVSINNITLEFADVPARDGAEAKRVPLLTFSLLREGANSLYGNISAEGDDDGEVIGFIRGIGVYPELATRKVAMPLTRTPRAGETITVSFSSDDPQLRNVKASGFFTAP